MINDAVIYYPVSSCNIDHYRFYLIVIVDIQTGNAGTERGMMT